MCLVAKIKEMAMAHSCAEVRWAWNALVLVGHVIYQEQRGLSFGWVSYTTVSTELRICIFFVDVECYRNIVQLVLED